MLSLSLITHTTFILFFITSILFGYMFHEPPKDPESTIFEMWEMKASSLAAAIILTIFILPVVSYFRNDTVGFFEIYQSAPLIFEVLVPINALLILQNLIPEYLDSHTEWADTSTRELLGFALACFLSVGIIAIPHYIVPLTPELADPELESLILYFAVVVWWITTRDTRKVGYPETN